ncbi:MAG TPA: DNA (cytosine-5-)-methyltransferase [Candidatus Omnitrophota bacterium]|nr:DNA (cytosine-5-)-methyltransferase [Candidatus Omnitrophota bacterium]
MKKNLKNKNSKKSARSCSLEANFTENRFSKIRRKAGLSFEDIASLSGYNLRTVYRWEKGEATPRKPVFDLIEKCASSILCDALQPAPFTFIDLFAGIGGMRMGFESIGGECIFTSEWNKYSQVTYLKNFPSKHEIAGDITGIQAEEIPRHDVLLAGFPCQPFSIAGVSKKNALGKPHGFLCKTQGTLFFDVARIIAHHKPAAFLLENVKNLISHDKGNTFKIILSTLRDELGYDVSYRVIDAQHFVPQHRERIFIVGFKKSTGFTFNNFELPFFQENPKLGTILHPENGEEEAENPYTEGGDARVSKKYTLTPNLWQYLQNYAAKHKAQGNGFGFGLFGAFDVARTLSARYYKDGSEILIKQAKKNPRRLTPRECARLMGFDAPNKKFIIPVSDTQAYKQFGNAVVVPVVKAVARHMQAHILKLAPKQYLYGASESSLVLR